MREKIKKINNYLKQYLWMDFCVSNIKEGMVQIDGNTDFSWNKNSIEILFKEAIYISTVLYEWHKSEKEDFIEIVDNEQTRKHLGFSPMDGYISFRINGDGERIWIFSKYMDYKIYSS